MNCSLGRVSGSNPYTNYRFLEGNISLSKNLHALGLYSGSIGAFLNLHEPPNWFHSTLIEASNWLKENNPIFNQYNASCDTNELTPANSIPMPLPLATPTSPSTPTTNSPTMPSLVVPNEGFPSEIQNEDYRYHRLMAGFMKLDDIDLPISYNNPDLEAMMFPDLFPTGRGHYEDMKKTLGFNTIAESYGKYIKLRMLCPDSRFRLHWYWPHWSYLNLEKRRNFQYNYRIINQKKVSRKYHPSRAELIGRSIYSNMPIIDESKMTAISSNLRTAAPFFQKKQLQVNTMIQSYDLPQIFYTLTMAEDKWKHLEQILSKTDNNDTLPTNRPLHVYLFYHNKLNNLRKKLWKNEKLVQWGKLENYFEHDEFQNRGTIHTHSFAYTEVKIPELIMINTIRADVSDPNLEPELYLLVRAYQVHKCHRDQCGGPNANNEPCKKGFPQPLSETTHKNNNSL